MPGRLWYWIAAGILFASVAAFVLFLYARLDALAKELPQIVVPGMAEVALEEPGSYTVFHESESVAEGRYYAAPEISGLGVEVAAVATGETIPLSPPAASVSYTLGGRSGVSIFTFEIAEPGTYRVSAAYADGRAEPRTVLAIGHAFGAKLTTTILGTIAIGLAGFGLATAIAVVTFLKRRAAMRAAQAPAARQPS